MQAYSYTMSQQKRSAGCGVLPNDAGDQGMGGAEDCSSATRGGRSVGRPFGGVTGRQDRRGSARPSRGEAGGRWVGQSRICRRDFGNRGSRRGVHRNFMSGRNAENSYFRHGRGAFHESSSLSDCMKNVGLNNDSSLSTTLQELQTTSRNSESPLSESTRLSSISSSPQLRSGMSPESDIPALQITGNKQGREQCTEAAPSAPQGTISSTSPILARMTENYSGRLSLSSSEVSQSASCSPHASLLRHDLEDLPIMKFRKVIIDHVRNHPITCIQGETGCGKSTRVPLFLLDDERECLRKKTSTVDDGISATRLPFNVVVTQPRRLACIALAKRVAMELNQPMGMTVGYRIGGESTTGRSTKLTFVTTGYLLQVLVNNPQYLRSCSHIIIDEVHERHLDADLLSLVIRLQMERFPALRLIVMSATFQGDLFAKYFCPPELPVPKSIFVGAKRFPVQTLFLDDLFLHEVDDLPGLPLTVEALEQQAKAIPCATEGIAEEESWRLINQVGLNVTKAILESKKAKNIEWLRQSRVSIERTLREFDIASKKACAPMHSGAKGKTREGGLSKASNWTPSSTNGDLLPSIRPGHDLLCYDLIKNLAKGGESVLVFLPGMSEITDLYESLGRLECQSTSVAGRRWVSAVDPHSVNREASGNHPSFASTCATQHRTPQSSGPLNASSKYRIFVLHSMISADEQESVLTQPPSDTVHVVLASNIAESSLTLPKVRIVIDFCLRRQLIYDPTRHMTNLVRTWTSHASCQQRSGRTGRVFPGICIRLISRAFYNRCLPQFDASEMETAPLEKVYLTVKNLSAKFSDMAVDGSRFFSASREDSEIGEKCTPSSSAGLNRGTISPSELLQLTLQPPDIRALHSALLSLDELGAVTGPDEQTASITALGHLMMHLPIDIHLSRLVLFGIMMGVTADSVVLAAALSTMDPFTMPSRFVIRNPAEYSEKLQQSLQSRAAFDAGQYSEPIMLRNLFVQWLTEFAEDISSIRYRVSRPHLHVGRRKELNMKMEYIRVSRLFARKHAVASKRIVHTAMTVMDICTRLKRLLPENSRASDILGIMLDILQFSNRPHAPTHRSLLECPRAVVEVVQNLFTQKPLLLKALLTAAFAPWFLFGSPKVSMTGLSTESGVVQEQMRRWEKIIITNKFGIAASKKGKKKNGNQIDSASVLAVNGGELGFDVCESKTPPALTSAIESHLLLSSLKEYKRVQLMQRLRLDMTKTLTINGLPPEIRDNKSLLQASLSLMLSGLDFEVRTTAQLGGCVFVTFPDSATNSSLSFGNSKLSHPSLLVRQNLSKEFCWTHPDALLPSSGLYSSASASMPSRIPPQDSAPLLKDGDGHVADEDLDGECEYCDDLSGFEDYDQDIDTMEDLSGDEEPEIRMAWASSGGKVIYDLLPFKASSPPLPSSSAMFKDGQNVSFCGRSEERKNQHCQKMSAGVGKLFPHIQPDRPDVVDVTLAAHLMNQFGGGRWKFSMPLPPRSMIKSAMDRQSRSSAFSNLQRPISVVASSPQISMKQGNQGNGKDRRLSENVGLPGNSGFGGPNAFFMDDEFEDEQGGDDGMDYYGHHDFRMIRPTSPFALTWMLGCDDSCLKGSGFTGSTNESKLQSGGKSKKVKRPKVQAVTNFRNPIGFICSCPFLFSRDSMTESSASSSTEHHSSVFVQPREAFGVTAFIRGTDSPNTIRVEGVSLLPTHVAFTMMLLFLRHKYHVDFDVVVGVDQPRMARLRFWNGSKEWELPSFGHGATIDLSDMIRINRVRKIMSDLFLRCCSTRMVAANDDQCGEVDGTFEVGGGRNCRGDVTRQIIDVDESMELQEAILHCLERHSMNVSPESVTGSMLEYKHSNGVVDKKIQQQNKYDGDGIEQKEHCEKSDCSNANQEFLTMRLPETLLPMSQSFIHPQNVPAITLLDRVKRARELLQYHRDPSKNSANQNKSAMDEFANDSALIAEELVEFLSPPCVTKSKGRNKRKANSADKRLEGWHGNGEGKFITVAGAAERAQEFLEGLSETLTIDAFDRRVGKDGTMDLFVPLNVTAVESASLTKRESLIKRVLDEQNQLLELKERQRLRVEKELQKQTIKLQKEMERLELGTQKQASKARARVLHEQLQQEQRMQKLNRKKQSRQRHEALQQQQQAILQQKLVKLAEKLHSNRLFEKFQSSAEAHDWIQRTHGTVVHNQLGHDDCSGPRNHHLISRQSSQYSQIQPLQPHLGDQNYSHRNVTVAASRDSSNQQGSSEQSRMHPQNWNQPQQQQIYQHGKYPHSSNLSNSPLKRSSPSSSVSYNLPSVGFSKVREEPVHQWNVGRPNHHIEGPPPPLFPSRACSSSLPLSTTPFPVPSTSDTYGLHLSSPGEHPGQSTQQQRSNRIHSHSSMPALPSMKGSFFLASPHTISCYDAHPQQTQYQRSVIVGATDPSCLPGQPLQGFQYHKQHFKKPKHYPHYQQSQSFHSSSSYSADALSTYQPENSSSPPNFGPGYRLQ